jgi:DNA modification methylase
VHTSAPQPKGPPVTPKLGTAHVIRGNALHLPIPDATVDLVVTSPPYFGLRSYQDGGTHYDGQIGAEPTPTEFVDALIAATREMIRVTKPTGSIWVNLGDKYSTGNSGQSGMAKLGERYRGGGHTDAKAKQRTPAVEGMQPKSLIGIPWRYALRCIDDLGLILRRDQIWSKPNGLPESVTDRCRSSHEYWFHFVKQPRYYSAIDEIREEHVGAGLSDKARGLGYTRTTAGDTSGNDATQNMRGTVRAVNPLGKLPGSVWEIPTQPLTVPEHLGIDHYAAFPLEWPRRIIAGWSPPGICTACGQGRRPVVATTGLDMTRPQARRAHQLAEQAGLTEDHFAALLAVGLSDTGRGAATQNGTGKNSPEVYRFAAEARAALGGYSREYVSRRPTGLGYVCACPDTTAPTTPSVILDPFGGTGTTALAAKAAGRTGITIDMSADYCRLATWRTTDPRELASAMQVDKPAPVAPNQLDLLEGLLG